MNRHNNTRLGRGFELHALARVTRRVASTRTALAAVVGSLVATAALAVSMASTAATSSNPSTYVYSSLDRFRAEGPVPGAAAPTT